jgi:uncharacterized protein (TIGR02284 family)
VEARRGEDDSSEVTMNTQHLIAALSTLAQASRDGAKGFDACARDAKSRSLTSMFEASAARCSNGAAELEAEIRKLGGRPAATGGVVGTPRQTWVDIISSLTSLDENAVLEECERGEDAAMRAYEAALEEDLPLNIERIIRRQYASVKENHYRIRAVRSLSVQAN